MDIDRSLVKAFVDVLPKNAKNTEGTVYGTVVTYDEELHVQIDGSSSVIPIKSLPATATVKNGDRVIVQLKDHNATITGNLSDQSVSGTQLTEQVTRFDAIIADKASIDELNAQKATIEELIADYVTVNGRLDAAYAEIDKLVAEDVTITGKLEANEAEFESLYSDYADFKTVTANRLTVDEADIGILRADLGLFEDLTTENFTAVNGTIDNLNTNKLDSNFANIDYANIDEAHIKQLYAVSGLIQYVTAEDMTVTGHLVGVHISGDLIDANTIVADKLMIKGKDGLYYRLNAEQGTFTEMELEDPILQNGIHGDVIIASSIAADKISVSDLTAFEAKLANFTIDIDDTTKVGELYSGVKDSVDNATTGIYLSSDGQMAIGDANNYLKFYKDGAEYKFELSLLDNFMSLDDDGLQLGDRRGGIWNGYRTQTTGDSYNILDNKGNILAKYGTNKIDLGIDSTNSEITFCGDKGRILYGDINKYTGAVDENSEDGDLQISSDYVEIQGRRGSALRYRDYTLHGNYGETDSGISGSTSAVQISKGMISIFVNGLTNGIWDEIVGDYVSGSSESSSIDVNPNEIAITAEDYIRLFTYNYRGIDIMAPGDNATIDLEAFSGVHHKSKTFISSDGKSAYNDRVRGWYFGIDGTAHTSTNAGAYIGFHYANSAAATSNIQESSSGVISINGMDYGVNNILWSVNDSSGNSAGWYMSANQTAALTKSITSQPNGIVLVFSRHNGGSKNYHFNSIFVPKSFVTLHSGCGHTFIMSTLEPFALMCSKYLYIHNTTIAGHDVNTTSGTGASGIKYDNAGFVLRYVIGV